MEKNVLDHWCDAAVKRLRFPPDREAVRQELRDHLQDRQADFEAQGMSQPEAERAALRAMGDAVAVGKELNRVHQPWLGWLWLASKAAVVLAAVGLLAVLHIYGADFSTPFPKEPREPCMYANAAMAFPGFEKDYVSVETGAVRHAGTYDLTLDHGFYYDSGERQWMVVCFHIRSKRLFDSAPSGLLQNLMAEDDLGNSYCVGWNRTKNAWLASALQNEDTKRSGVWSVHMYLDAVDQAAWQWVRFYVPDTDFSVTIRTNGEVEP